jgi:hypothetical protein
VPVDQQVFEITGFAVDADGVRCPSMQRPAPANARASGTPKFPVREGDDHMSDGDRNGWSAALLTNADWRKSSLSGELGNCVEVARLVTGEFAVRNSRHPEGPALVFMPDEWAAFVGGVMQGEFAPAQPVDERG